LESRGQHRHVVVFKKRRERHDSNQRQMSGFETEWDPAPVASGLWTLEVVDGGGEAVGRINGFSVHTFVAD
ncbi:MAG: hypothetical protein KUG77_21420, partial [Nannocystaceae bacterium]|nr:hypothetical protein [Nannocystaceae bacterium]